MSIIERIQAWDSRRRTKANNELISNFSVDAAEKYVSWYDHGFLRRFWSNRFEIRPGVFRSNYPNGRRFAELSSLGIRSILNLRGGAGTVPYLLEEHYATEAGIAFYTVNLDARRAPKPDELLKLLDLFDVVERPFLMHCKSGADRAGLASALYLLHIEGASIDEAQEMLSFKYLHVNDRKTGIMGHVLKSYGQASAASGISLRKWITNEYDPERAQQEFDLSRQ